MIGGTTAGRVLRWGVPASTAPVPTRVFEELDAGVERGVPIIVQGPTGSGKTTAVAAWLGDRHDWDAVWLTVTGGDWDPLRRAYEKAVGMAPGDADEPSMLWWGRFLAHLRSSSRRIVVVIDGVDKIAGEFDMDRVLASLEQAPELTAVLISRRPMVPGDGGIRSRAQVISSELAWDTGDARAALRRAGLDVPAVVVEAIRMRADGLAEAILACAQEWTDDRHGVPVEERRSVERLVAEWMLARVAVVCGTGLDRLVLVTASLVEVPTEFAGEVADLLGVDRHDVDRLVDHGFLHRRPAVSSGRMVYVAPPTIASELCALAQESLPVESRAAHELAAAHESASAMQMYHRAVAGDVAAASRAVLEHWRTRRGPGQETLLAVLRTLPGERIAAEPVLAALRVVADCHAPRWGRTPAPAYQDALLDLDADALRVLDLPDRLLVEGAVVDVLLDRGKPEEVVRRAGAIAEQQAEGIHQVDPRAREALGYLLTGVAEAHISLLRPDHAMALVEPVLRTSGRDRWLLTGYRASVVAALVYCLNGERDRMEGKLQEAERFFRLGSYEPGPMQNLEWLTEIFDATTRRDAEVVESIAARFAAFGSESFITDVFAAAVLLTRGEFAAASGSLGRTLSSSRFPLQSVLVRALILAMSAEAGLAEGRPGAVLNLLGSSASPPRHAICFDAYRAAAHLALGAPARALDETSECVKPASRHSARTLAKVTALRAAAHLELRHREAARSDMIAALHLTPPAWLVSTLGILPPVSVSELRDLVADDLPSDTVAALDELTRDRDGSTRAFADALSPKEAQLLELLGGEGSLREIAQQLFVSINTIKTQNRSLYRKLGVRSRREAVDLAHSLGIGATSPGGRAGTGFAPHSIRRPA